MHIHVFSCFVSHNPSHTPASVNLRASSLGYTIRDRAIRHGGVFPVARVVVLRSRQRSCLDLQKSGKLAPPIRPVTARREARTKGERPLVDEKMHVICSWARRIGIRWRGTIGGYGMRGLDNLDVNACSKGLKVGYDELLVCWRSSRRQELCELGEAESGQHGCEVGVVGEVKVEGLVKRECGGAAVKSDVGLSCRGIQGVVV